MKAHILDAVTVLMMMVAACFGGLAIAMGNWTFFIVAQVAAGLAYFFWLASLWDDDARIYTNIEKRS